MTEYTQAEDAWIAYQFDLPDAGEGLIVIIRRPSSPYGQAVFPLHALEEQGQYEFTNVKSGEKWTATGKDLSAKGLSMRLLGQPDSSLVCYRRR